MSLLCLFWCASSPRFFVEIQRNYVSGILDVRSLQFSKKCGLHMNHSLLYHMKKKPRDKNLRFGISIKENLLTNQIKSTITHTPMCLHTRQTVWKLQLAHNVHLYITACSQFQKKETGIFTHLHAKNNCQILQNPLVLSKDGMLLLFQGCRCFLQVLLLGWGTSRFFSRVLQKRNVVFVAVDWLSMLGKLRAGY